jgi:hypothetical protein
MMPGLGQKYDIEIKVTSKPNADYNTDEYFDLDLPVAPAVMVGNEIITEGTDVDQYDLEAAICRQLSLPLPEKGEKGFFAKLFNK